MRWIDEAQTGVTGTTALIALSLGYGLHADGAISIASAAIVVDAGRASPFACASSIHSRAASATLICASSIVAPKLVHPGRSGMYAQTLPSSARSNTA